MLNNLKDYCSSINLELYKSVENSLGFKGVINEKTFTITVEDNEYIICIADDTLFKAFATVLQAKYRTLLLIKRNVTMFGQIRPYNLCRFTCRKESKVKVILGQVERIYYDLLNEKIKIEKVGNKNE